MGGFMMDDEDEDEDEYSSPIDNINELVAFSETLTQAAANSPEAYAQLRAALPPQTQQLCEQVMQGAAAKKAELERQAQQGQSMG